MTHERVVSAGAPGSFASLTKIVATVGPASSDAHTIAKLIAAGVSVFRFNFGHGRLDEHAARLKLIRAAAERVSEPTAVLGDLQGPRIRVGALPSDGLDLAVGSVLVVERGLEVGATDADGTRHRIGCTHDGLVDDAAPGERLLINDGAIRALIVEKTADRLTCRVTTGGVVTSGKGMNFPDSEINVPCLTPRDWEHVAWAIENDLDFLALSFVRSPDDVRELAAGISQRAGASFRVPIIAKIETPRALERIEEIVTAADGLMVARGDLGVEMEIAEVPVIQRRLLEIAQHHGKPCIVATQMLESMITNPTPTRAEVSDVAGAIFAFADAVMLSGETAVGRYPVLAVDAMRRTAECAGAYLAAQPAVPSPPARLRESRNPAAALAHGVWTIAQDTDARCIAVWSQTGGGARYVSQNNFHVPILAFTSDARAARQMQLLRGVEPFCVPVPESLAAFSCLVDRFVLETGRGAENDACILMAGEPLGVARVTNRLAILRIGVEGSGFGALA